MLPLRFELLAFLLVFLVDQIALFFGRCVLILCTLRCRGSASSHALLVDHGAHGRLFSTKKRTDATGNAAHLSAACITSFIVCHRGITDRKSTRLNSSHVAISYAVFCLKKKTQNSDG